MTTNENKQLVGRYLSEVVNGRQFEVAGGILSPDFAMNHPVVTGTIKSAAGFRETMASLFSAFPDLHVTLEEVTAEQDAVAVRLGWRGTHRGEFIGFAATGQPFAITGSAVYHVIDGRITRAWEELDLFGLLQQVGALPGMASME